MATIQRWGLDLAPEPARLKQPTRAAQMSSPNFFILGVPKCGTSSLAWWLSQHPQVWFSRIKEPHFFNDDSGFRQVRAKAAYDRLF